MSHLVACLQNSVADCAGSQCLGFLPEFGSNEIIKTWRVDSEQIALFCAAFALRGCLEVWRKPSWIRIYARNPGRIFQHRIVSNGGRVRVPWGQPISSDAGCTMLHVSGGDDEVSPITWIRLLTHTTAQTKIAIVWESACQKQLQRTKSFVENRKPSESAMYERVNPHDGHHGAVAFSPRNDRSLPRTDTCYVNIMLNTFPQK